MVVEKCVSGVGWLTVVPLALCVLSSANAKPFSDGERVCFFGDSVTHHGYYASQVQLYYYTRFPDRDIRIWNCGTGGATAGESMIAVDGDILAKKPTHVVILFGMNDCGMPYYLPTASQWAINKRPGLLAAFKKNLPALYEKVRAGAPDAVFTFCTLVPWDDALKFKEREDEVGPVGVTAAQVGFCDVVRTLWSKAGGVLVDYYTPMLAWNAEHQKKDPYASLSPDRIHPREPGGLFMANLFLRAQQAPGIVSDVVIDASSGRIVKSENAVASDVAFADQGVCFRLQEGALPFAVLDPAKDVADEIGFTDEINSEMLTIRHLKAGDWALKIDGVEILTAPAAMWAKGINLAMHETPMLKQAKTVREAVLARSEVECSLRMLWVDRNVLWRRLQQINQASHKELYQVRDVDDERIYKAFAKGFAEAYKGGDGEGAAFVRYMNRWERRSLMLEEIEKRHQEIRTLNRPQPHVFELVRVR